MTPPSTPPTLPDPSQRFRRLLIAGVTLSGVLYLASLGLPVLVFENHEPVSGAEVLAVGWMGPFAAGQFAWYANPLYFATIVLTLRSKFGLALAFALPAVGIALTSPQSHTWYFNESTGTPIARLAGTWMVWLAAIAVAGLTSVAGCFLRRTA
ncbi:MAG: hypothetical protein KA004_02750 [Verrucomicrobiales bacterium]|nr:hypothetical protein [Verrucomicrobiales bacterium]